MAQNRRSLPWSRIAGYLKANMAGPRLKGRETKKAAPLAQGGKTLRAYNTLLAYLMLAVMGGVVTARLGVVVLGVAGMTVRGVGVVRRLLVIAGFVVLRGFAMMFCRMLVMLGGLVMMLDVAVFAHVALPAYG